MSKELLEKRDKEEEMAQETMITTGSVTES
jgi:hypothetical protein